MQQTLRPLVSIKVPSEHYFAAELACCTVQGQEQQQQRQAELLLQDADFLEGRLQQLRGSSGGSHMQQPAEQGGNAQHR